MNSRRLLISFLLSILMLSGVVKSQGKSDQEILIYCEALIRSGRYQEASEKLGTVTNSSLWRHYLMGVANQYQGNPEEAIDQYRMAIKFSEDERSMRALSFLGIGQILMEKEKYQEAIDTLTVVTERYYGKLMLSYPKCPAYNYLDSSQGAIHNIADDAQFLIAECYEKLGQREAAQNAFAKLERFYPFSTKVGDARAIIDNFIQ